MASESSKSSSPSPSPSPSSSPSLSSLPTPSLGNSVGDTFIGSFITLISKYEMRYEGILYHLNLQDSALGLQNVRSYGTEGRKKDGPQIPPCERVYDYILFRGSDIKDLQVNSPSAQSRLEIQSAQDISQSSSSMPAMSSPLSGYDSGYGLRRGAQWVNTPALSSKSVPAAQYSPIPSSFQPPSANAGNLTESTASLIGSTNTFQATQSNVDPSMPMPSFVQGKKLAPSGVPFGLMQQSLSSPSTMHNDPQIVDNFASPVMGLVNNTSQVVTRPTDLVSNPSYSKPSPPCQAKLHTPPGLASSPSNHFPLTEAQFSAPNIQNSYPIAPQAVGKVLYDSQSNHLNRTIPYELPAVSSELAPVISGSLSNLPESFFSMEPLPQSRQQVINRGQEMFAGTNPGSVGVASRSLATTNHAPLLPLPFSAHQSWIPSSSIEFTEEFDFEAMNEKFKKSELWGFLGENNRRNQNDYREETAAEQSALGKTKPAYNKDDFFDTISCNPLDRVARSEQQHTQPEVLGNNFQRPPQPQPGQGAYLAAQTNYRGGYYNNNNDYSNSGYGYYSGGRGRGRNPHF